MAKINIRDVESINELLETTLQNHSILGYEMVTFKTGRGRFAPISEVLVVRSWDRSTPHSTKIAYYTFRIEREGLCNSIESLIKL